MRKWCQIATGTDRATRRHDRSDVAIEQLDQRLNDLHPHTGMTARQRGRQEHHHRARDVDRQWLTDTDGMAPHDIDLQLRKLMIRDPYRLKRTKASGHAVDCLPFARHASDHLGGRTNAHPSVLAEFDIRLPRRNRHDLRAGQGSAIKEHGLGGTHRDIIAHSRPLGQMTRQSAAVRRSAP